MLDSTTKKRIDDCRDILVGKLPDPENPKQKKLVPFSQYSWDNLFNTKVTAAEMLRLYSEAITGMDKNPNMPQLFRDIFKNAFLPYRDPETLKLFLKTIGEFEYTHSEKLGDAFEYLLSVMGSQGDAGQFRTPRHIIDFLVAVVNPGKKDTILDPACGTAGFLISAFKHIMNDGNGYRHGRDAKAGVSTNTNTITPDERKKIIRNFTGYDISPDMVRLSLVNLYLHGFNDPHIWEYDTLSSEERWDETADVILANPPFMSPKGGIRPHKKFSISSNRSEVLFVDYIAEHLNPKGRAGIIVPEGVIFQSGTAYKELRKMLVENYLYAVVSLPAGVFNPYSGVKTSILLMDASFAKASNEILFVKIENDGYGLGAQRTPVKGSQLEEAIELIQQFKEGSFTESELAHAVAKNEIAKNGDYNLSGERYKADDKLKSSIYDLVELGKIFKLSSGRGLTQKNLIAGPYDVFGGNGVNGKHNDYFLEEPTIVIGRVGEYCGAVHISTPKAWVTDNGLYVTNYLIEINQEYLALVLGKLDLNRFAKVGGQPSISQSTIYELQIPLPPLSIQEEIVAEIEGWQKIIDGAKAVTENYKHKIDINPAWEMVELGEMCEVNPKKSELKDLDDDLKVSFVPMADLNENQIDFIPTQVKPLGEVIKGYTYFKDDDVLLAKVTPCFENGKAGIAKNLVNGIGFGSSEYFVIRPNQNILSTWIYLNIITDYFREKGKLNMTGTGGLQRVPPDFLKSTLIPLPPIETQHQIVSQIEKEQALVNANKQLIEIFEQKIKDRIAKVWGADKQPAVYKENDALTMAAEE